MDGESGTNNADAGRYTRVVGIDSESAWARNKTKVGGDSGAVAGSRCMGKK